MRKAVASAWDQRSASRQTMPPTTRTLAEAAKALNSPKPSPKPRPPAAACAIVPAASPPSVAAPLRAPEPISPAAVQQSPLNAIIQIAGRVAMIQAELRTTIKKAGGHELELCDQLQRLDGLRIYTRPDLLKILYGTRIIETLKELKKSDDSDVQLLASGLIKKWHQQCSDKTSGEKRPPAASAPGALPAKRSSPGGSSAAGGSSSAVTPSGSSATTTAVRTPAGAIDEEDEDSDDDDEEEEQEEDDDEEDEDEDDDDDVGKEKDEEAEAEQAEEEAAAEMEVAAEEVAETAQEVPDDSEDGVAAAAANEAAAMTEVAAAAAIAATAAAAVNDLIGGVSQSTVAALADILSTKPTGKLKVTRGSILFGAAMHKGRPNLVDCTPSRRRNRCQTHHTEARSSSLRCPDPPRSCCRLTRLPSSSSTADGIGIVTKVPTPLDDHYEMRFLWRYPLEGEEEEGAPVEVREHVAFWRNQMTARAYLVLRAGRSVGDTELAAALPRHYTIDDVKLLEKGLEKSDECWVPPFDNGHEDAIVAAGFNCVRAR